MDVHVDGLRFARGGRAVLSIPTLHVHGNRTTAVLGPNGAGKTTLLRLMAGLERPDSGRVLVGGEAAGRRRRRVAYVFQEQVFLRRSILENVELGLRIGGLDRSQARERAVEALRLLNIEGLADRRGDRISGGEGRRASLARALCLRAPLLLLDEPLAGLDGTTYLRLLDDLPMLVRASGVTAVIVTHDRREAFRLADDLVVLVDGRIAAAGAKGEIAANPRRAQVARVLGYTILQLGGRAIAVPDRALELGRGGFEFTAMVDAVHDLVSEWEVVVTIGQSRARISMARTAIPPTPGERVPVRASTVYDISE
jgi:ABC-type sulfate/molybdate transport systems ATPase subunit